jgi:hypothetical protein
MGAAYLFHIAADRCVPPVPCRRGVFRCKVPRNSCDKIGDADVAFYNAKETGRNRVVRFTKEMWKDEQY